MKVIGIDLGGTKIAAAVVDKNGKIHKEIKVPTQSEGGWKSLREQLIGLCKDFSAHKPKAIGIGSAGPLHAPSGQLLDPTNFGWKSPLKVHITRELSKSLRLPVMLENDAAAAVLAEHWKGKAKNNSVVITLGTGLGVGVIANGKLVRGGRELHPEGGHLLLRPGDTSALCGCGNYGCAEAFLSGKNFAKRAGLILGMQNLDAITLDEMAKDGHVQATKLFQEYGQLLGEFLHNLVVLYYPEEVILTGSFANTSSHFLSISQERLHQLIERRLKTIPLMPKIRISRLQNKAGVLGGAYIALHPKNYA